MMVMALGGRVAEEIFFNRITTGASDDIKKVTQIAAGLVTQYGMSPALGCINYTPEEGYQKSYSDETGALIDEEIRKIIDQAYNRCKTLLSEKRDLIQK
jgi:AFG3 family protein